MMLLFWQEQDYGAIMFSVLSGTVGVKFFSGLAEANVLRCFLSAAVENLLLFFYDDSFWIFFTLPLSL